MTSPRAPGGAGFGVRRRHLRTTVAAPWGDAGRPNWPTPLSFTARPDAIDARGNFCRQGHVSGRDYLAAIPLSRARAPEGHGNQF